VKDNGYALNANNFPSRAIETEVKQSSPSQPVANSTPGASSTWDGLFTQARVSGGITAPYHDVKVADATKLGVVAWQYQSFLSTGDPSRVPSMTNLFTDATFVDLGIQPPDFATPQELLSQSCAGCHNGRVDPSLTRSRFNVDALGSLPRAEKDLAIARVMMAAQDVRHMPPVATKSLTAAQVATLVAELSK